ncbi:MAG: hypothetical protein H6550_09490 [Chitinophagales bacterium]|nr:hypothetical protein [Chitinophagales bacterium]MCB9046359.1 hypothetical protein [Chitinophagales bacterium]MCB9046360.1 hypothetical protein [Chitinophagales bacterium]
MEDLKPILVEILARLRMQDNERLQEIINDRTNGMDSENIRIINETEAKNYKLMLQFYIDQVSSEV